MSEEKLVEVGVTFSYWGLEDIVSNNFNRLKAKLFNLVEASVPDKIQADAIKGLIKGFANDEFRYALENMRFHARAAGWIDEKENGSIMPLEAQPLEGINFGDGVR